MGVFLLSVFPVIFCICLPHVRGGVSYPRRRSADEVVSSPRAWGCFLPANKNNKWRKVFPTCVGVFLIRDVVRLMKSCLPHVRGGVSFMGATRSTSATSSPRAWGCFCTGYLYHSYTEVFPTCVGVFPAHRLSSRETEGLPHVRGGVSGLQMLETAGLGSSPRAWGCFRQARRYRTRPMVFPTCVGVFQLHRRMGGHGGRSSPRAWGCF